MKKNTLTPAVALFAIAFTGLFASCGKMYGDPTTVNYPIEESYTKLDVSHAFDVTVSNSVTEAVVTLPEELHSKLKLKVRNGTLSIGFNSPFITTSGKCSVVLPSNAQLKDLRLSGASCFTGDLQGNSNKIDLSGASEYYGSVQTAYLNLKLSGASQTNCNIITDNMDIALSGASKATLQGNCTTTMDICVSGASDLRAGQFDTDVVTGFLSGASEAEVTVCGRVAVNVSGASTLVYGTSSPSCRPTYGCTTTGSSTVTPQ